VSTEARFSAANAALGICILQAQGKRKQVLQFEKFLLKWPGVGLYGLIVCAGNSLGLQGP